MEQNPYAAPRSEVIAAPTELPQFYIVSPRKFLIMLFATFGWYRLYWFYRNWSLYKAATKGDLWPVPRAIFSIFFAHSLCDAVQKKLEREKQHFEWNPTMLVFLYIAFTIAGNILDRAAGKEIWMPYSAMAPFFVFPIWGWAMWRMQLAINAASLDGTGVANASLTPLNWLWIVLGLCWWAVCGLGLYLIWTGQ